MTWLFIDPSETEVVNVSVLYFQYGVLVLSVFGKYFFIPEYASGNGIWTCSHAGRCF